MRGGLLERETRICTRVNVSDVSYVADVVGGNNAGFGRGE